MQSVNEKSSKKELSQHPHGEDISAYLDGMLDIRKTRNIAQHIGACPECSALHQSLRQVKFRLRELPTPQSPGPDFWQNTYRELRVKGSQRQSWLEGLRESLAQQHGRTRRRVAVGVAMAALACGALATPLLVNPPASAPTPAASADVVDLSSLVRAHAQYAASQPLADPDHQTMISADTDVARVIAPAVLGDGGSFAADSAP